jgi:hypothetical protein
MKFQWVVAIGTIIGGSVASWTGPKLISWYFTPPVKDMLNCNPAIEWALSKLQIFQMAGLVGGFLVSAILYITLRKKSPALQPE